MDQKGERQEGGNVSVTRETSEFRVLTYLRPGQTSCSPLGPTCWKRRKCNWLTLVCLPRRGWCDQWAANAPAPDPPGLCATWRKASASRRQRKWCWVTSRAWPRGSIAAASKNRAEHVALLRSFTTIGFVKKI
jgi:hypothetical protein